MNHVTRLIYETVVNSPELGKGALDAIYGDSPMVNPFAAPESLEVKRFRNWLGRSLVNTINTNTQAGLLMVWVLQSIVGDDSTIQWEELVSAIKGVKTYP